MKLEARMKLERKVVRHLVRLMKSHDWIAVEVNDGEERIKTPRECDVMDSVFGVDESHIIFQKTIDDKKIRHAVLIVLGNDGWDAIADYGFSEKDDFGVIMSDEMDKWIDKIQDECC